ncbi:MAG: hydroxymethylpyrimidine/phosphomethylpyrimidine kinase [Alcaligenaceae bacterium]|nr:hydroxymethylpyrimidine/phosphomethylpyrimidine kinase [Alcaligenaceae bacterium]
MIFGPFDPSGSTGLPADAVTSAELGCHAISVLTGSLVQDTAVLENIEPITPELMDDQARCLLEDMPAHAIKAGALYTTESVSALAQIVADYSNIPLIVHLQRMPHVSVEDEFDAEDTQAALLELVLPQTDLVVVDHTLLQQWQSHGLLPGHTLAHAMDALLNYGASALLVSGVPGTGAQRDYLLRDEHGQSTRWPSPVSDPVSDSDGLLATALTTELARGTELPQAVDRSVAIVNAMAKRIFQPGMGGRIFNRSRS